MESKKMNKPSRTLLSVVTSAFAVGFVAGRFFLTGTFGLIVIIALIILLGYCWIQSETIRLDKIDSSDVDY